MPRPGTGGGGHRSASGHDYSRVGGGHHVGNSTNRPLEIHHLIEVQLLEMDIIMFLHHQEEDIMVIIETIIHIHQVA